jgi:hypothetical protein
MTTDVDFEAAFAEAVGAEPEEVITEVEETPEPGFVAEEPAVDEVEEVVAEAEVEPAADVVADEPVEAVVEAAPAAQPAVQQMDTQQLATAIAEANRLAQQQAAPAKEEPAEQEREASFEDYLDDKQKKDLELFQAEWSEVAAPVSALIAAHVKAALTNQQKAILGQVQQQMAPIQQHAAQSQEAMYWSTIQAAHPDFQTVAGDLPAWIQEQPKLYQPRLMELYERGSATETVELISMYKQAKGSTGAAPAHPASSAVQATPKAPPVSSAALAATLAPPAAKRSAVSTSRDPNDADSAFKEAFG